MADKDRDPYHFPPDGLSVRAHMERLLGVTRRETPRPIVIRTSRYVLRPKCEDLRAWRKTHAGDAA